jgi:hypothetical protein
MIRVIPDSMRRALTGEFLNSFHAEQAIAYGISPLVAIAKKTFRTHT